jgi:hypothetical protein
VLRGFGDAQRAMAAATTAAACSGVAVSATDASHSTLVASRATTPTDLSGPGGVDAGDRAAYQGITRTATSSPLPPEPRDLKKQAAGSDNA